MVDADSKSFGRAILGRRHSVGTPTIVGDALKPIWDLTTSMLARTHGGRSLRLSVPTGGAEKAYPTSFRGSQLRMKVYEKGLRIKFKPNEAQLQEAYEFGYNFGKSVLAGKIVDPVKPADDTKRKWKCIVCGEVVEGPKPPEACPVCGVGPDQFVELKSSDTEFKSSKEEKIIIIGNGAAGTAACVEIRKRNPVADIEIISSEEVLGYNRPMLTKGILSKMDSPHFYIKPESWYKENNIKVTLGTTVTEINTEEKP